VGARSDFEDVLPPSLGKDHGGNSREGEYRDRLRQLPSQVVQRAAEAVSL
jgi:hypothetical protein